MQAVVLRDSAQQLRIAENQIRLGDNPQPQPAMQSKLLQNAARYVVTALGWLVWVGRGANGDAFPGAHMLQPLAQEPRGLLLHINFLLESQRIAQLHKLMRIAGVAVLARKLTSAIRIDGPLKRQSTRRLHPREQRASRKREIFNVVPLAQRIGVCRQPRNSN